jgi:hypothetical protein
MVIVARILIIIVLLPILAFCVFGFLATFEPGSDLRWRIGYAIGGFICLAGIAWTIIAKKR